MMETLAPSLAYLVCSSIRRKYKKYMYFSQFSLYALYVEHVGNWSANY